MPDTRRASTAVIGHFIDRLLDGGPFETDVRDNLETLRLVEQAYAAAESEHRR